MNTLAEQAFLLCYNLDKRRLLGRERLDPLVRAATLVELYLSGQLLDADGRAAPARDASVTDPVLRMVLDEIRQAPNRRWRHWVRRRARQTQRAVRKALVDRRVIGVAQSRFLGVFPRTTVTVRDTRAVRQLQASVRDALRQPVSRVEPEAAALVALAAAAEVGFVLGRKQRRAHADRIGRFVEVAGPAAGALRRVIASRRAAALSGAVVGSSAGG